MSDQTARPGLVWVITVFYALVFALMTLLGWFLLSHWDALPEPVNAPWRAIPRITWVLMVVGLPVCIAGIVQLFRLRRSAFYLYSGSVALGIAASFPSYLTAGLTVTQLIGLLVQMLVALYIWWLLRANVLR